MSNKASAAEPVVVSAGQSLRPDLAGLVALALLSAPPLAFVKERSSAAAVWITGFVALAALAVFAWRSERWPLTPAGALKLAAATAGAGVAVFSATAAVVMLAGAEAGFIASGLRGGPGLALAIALCPFLTAIALAGAVRNAVRCRAEAGR